MRWLWNRIGWFGRLKARFWAWAAMAMCLIFGGEPILNTLTHDEVTGRVTAIVQMCKIDCEKFRHIPSGVSTDPAPCPDVVATIARTGAEKCRPKRMDHYTIGFTGTDGKPAGMRLAQRDFDKPYRIGDPIPVMRDSRARALIAAPPSSFDFGAFAVGLVLFGWLLLRPFVKLLRAAPKRINAPPDLVGVPRTAAPVPEKKPQRVAVTRAPIVKQHQPKRGRYIVNGPIRTRKR